VRNASAAHSTIAPAPAPAASASARDSGASASAAPAARVISQATPSASGGSNVNAYHGRIACEPTSNASHAHTNAPPIKNPSSRAGRARACVTISTHRPSTPSSHDSGGASRSSCSAMRFK
jgi:hypothetical protein